MYQDFGTLTLKTGEKMNVGAVIAPDVEWKDRLVTLLTHKGGIWNWQNAEVLGRDVGTEVRFYVVHRDGAPISNILIAEHRGVGILGHVFTRPEERKKGSMGQLMARQMDDFRARGGQALFLGTGFDSHPYHMYASFGFRGIEDKSGYMEYYSASKEEFEGHYFARGKAEVMEANWTHWPASPALFMADVPGKVRCAPLRLFGRVSTEGSFLFLLKAEAERKAAGKNSQARVLQSKRTGAVVGLAMYDGHPLWPDTCLMDVYCHPNCWRRAGEMLEALSAPPADRCVAYGDPECPAKNRVLRRAGFRKVAAFRQRIAADRAKTGFVDVIEFEKRTT
jgi:GNAT superfamily N-acetyltransferase